MDVIKDSATKFSYTLNAYSFSLEKLDSEISSKMLYISKNSEKLRFLSYLKDIIESKYQSHIKVCREPDKCSQNKEFEICLYAINQQYDEYYSLAGGTNLGEKPAMNFFQEGKYFDAFTVIKEKIKESKQSILLIDNYVDENTLAFFPSKDPSIKQNFDNFKMYGSDIS